MNGSGLRRLLGQRSGCEGHFDVGAAPVPDDEASWSFLLEATYRNGAVARRDTARLIPRRVEAEDYVNQSGVSTAQRGGATVIIDAQAGDFFAVGPLSLFPDRRGQRARRQRFQRGPGSAACRLAGRSGGGHHHCRAHRRLEQFQRGDRGPRGAGCFLWPRSGRRCLWTSSEA